MTGAYFVSTADGLQPVPEARSPWADDMLHGRLLAGLAARGAEDATDDAEVRLARLTVDMFRSPPMTPFEVVTQPIRDGRRVRVLEISMRSGGDILELGRDVRHLVNTVYELTSRGLWFKVLTGHGAPGSIWRRWCLPRWAVKTARSRPPHPQHPPPRSCWPEQSIWPPFCGPKFWRFRRVTRDRIRF